MVRAVSSIGKAFSIFMAFANKNYSWRIVRKQLCDGLYQCGCICNCNTGNPVGRPQVSRRWSFLLMRVDMLLLHYFTLERQNSGREFLFSRTMCSCTLEGFSSGVLHVFFELRFKTN